MPDDALLESPLHSRHQALGATFAAFGGWSMPLQYPTGIVAEHTAVRERTGLFDVSHLGKLLVTGPGAAALVDATLTNDLGRIGPGRAQYTLCCDAETGGVVDDLIAYLSDDDHVLLVPNAANAAEVARLLAAAAPEGCRVVDHHRDYAVLALQGPGSDAVLAAVGLPTDLDYLAFAEAEHAGVGVVVCRTGYTGERGVELVVRNEGAGPLWDALLAAGEVTPCGLGARDTLRTEMGYPLHGQDLTRAVTPLQARLGWAVGWDKPAFWGRDALLAERATGPSRLLRGLLATGRAIPRPGMSISLVPDVLLTEVTSGTFSPTLKRGIGLALIPELVNPEAEVGVDVRGRREIFQLVKPPFVPSHVR